MLFHVVQQHDIEGKIILCGISIFIVLLFFLFKSNNLVSLKGLQYIKGIMCVQKHFLMVDEVRGIVVILLQKYDHYSSYFVNNRKVFPHTNDTFYGAVPYCIL